MFQLRPIDRLKFFLERQFVKGTFYQLMVMAALVGLISIIGGLLAFGTGAPGETVAESVWWAFLRLTDPGYLGDDQGTWRRVVSTLLTVSGYVVFMGALIAILTQWLISRMRILERGLTPVTLRHHVVVLGWTNRTMPILRELLLSESRIKRFLAELNLGRRKRLQLVVLAEELTHEMTEELRTDAVTSDHRRDVIIRSGSALNSEHLLRAACPQAAAIILPARTFDQHDQISSDVETIKALLSLDGQAQMAGARLPYVVAEIQDPRKTAIAKRAYRGELEVVAGDASISRLMVQNIRHPGLSSVYRELLSHNEGNNFYVRSESSWAGSTVAELSGRLPTSICCGVVRRESGVLVSHINPPGDFEVLESDAMLLIAPSYEEAGRPGPLAASGPKAVREEERQPAPKPSPNKTFTSVLVLGWSRKVPALLREMSTYGGHAFQITVVSTLSVAARRQNLTAEGIHLPDSMCRHVEADFTQEEELAAVDLEHQDCILLMSSDRFGSGEEADARTIIAYLQLEGLLRARSIAPNLLIELSDPHNERLMGGRMGEVIISPLLLSHILAQVALRRELRVVFDDLFSAGGPEIGFRRLGDLGIEPAGYVFEELQSLCRRRGETALGILHHDAGVEGNGRRLELNPRRAIRQPLLASDEIVVMTST